MNKRHLSDYYDAIDDDEYSLLGSRFARAVARNHARKAAPAHFDDGWVERNAGSRRPKHHRDRSY